MDELEARFRALLGSDESVTGRFEPPLVNIGVGTDITIAALAEAVQAAHNVLGISIALLLVLTRGKEMLPGKAQSVPFRIAMTAPDIRCFSRNRSSSA